MPFTGTGYLITVEISFKGNVKNLTDFNQLLQSIWRVIEVTLSADTFFI